MKTILIRGVLAGMIYFVLSAISWMALPWHNATLKPLADEAASADFLKIQAPEHGVYLIPCPASLDGLAV